MNLYYQLEEVRKKLKLLTFKVNSSTVVDLSAKADLVNGKVPADQLPAPAAVDISGKADLSGGKVVGSQLPTSDGITEGNTNKYHTDAKVIAITDPRYIKNGSGGSYALGTDGLAYGTGSVAGKKSYVVAPSLPGNLTTSQVFLNGNVASNIAVSNVLTIIGTTGVITSATVTASAYESGPPVGTRITFSAAISGIGTVVAVIKNSDTTYNYVKVLGFNSWGAQLGAIAIGEGCNVSSIYGTALGFGSTINASSDYGFAAGRNNTVSNLYGVAMGNACIASGNGAVSIGVANTASGTGARALGSGTQATASNAHADGDNCRANSANSYSRGSWAGTLHSGEYAQASARFSAVGDAQTSMVDLMLSATITAASPVNMLVANTASAYITLPNTGEVHQGTIRLCTTNASGRVMKSYDYTAFRKLDSTVAVSISPVRMSVNEVIDVTVTIVAIGNAYTFALQSTGSDITSQRSHMAVMYSRVF